MVKRFLLVIFIVFLSMGLNSPVFGYEVNLTIPQYGQELSYWSGPACAQMILNGYPDPYPSIYYTQSEIWICIQSHNSGEPGWATDPEGMQGALIELNPPPPGTTWGLKSFDIREDLMFRILYWINQNSFAVTTLVNSGYHWVDVVGYVTDIEPLWGSDPELQEITIHDPWPPPGSGGEISTMTGTVWYDTMWENPVENAGAWYNKYVAIIEPPETQGGVIVRVVDRRGTTAILAAEALQFSQTWIEQLNLDLKDPSYAALSDEDTQHLEPILVREEINFNIRKDERVPYYYIIPYAAKNDNALSANENDGSLEYSSISVIVNAFTGDFEQVSSFGRPIRYLTEEEAIKAAAEALNLEESAMKGVEAEMVYLVSTVTQSRAIPICRVDANGNTVYVDQSGKVYTKSAIIPQLYGR